MADDFRCKLAAILSADVEGCSRLMGWAEDSTIRTLTPINGPSQNLKTPKPFMTILK